MSKHPPPFEIVPATQSDLADALENLERRGINVIRDGEPPRYRIGKQVFTESGLIAYSTRIIPRSAGRFH